MHKMFGGSAYLFAIIKYFSFAFFREFLLQRNLFPLRLCHQTSATMLRYLRSSTFYRAPFKLGFIVLRPVAQLYGQVRTD